MTENETEKGKLIIEGKTKAVYENLNELQRNTVIIGFKPDITALDGEKRQVIEGKAEIDCRTNNNFFRLFNAWGILTHYLHQLNDTEFLAKKLIRKAPFEVVTRRVAAGSIVDRDPNIKVGHHFKKLYTEIFYKDDFFNDPLIDAGYIKVKDKKGYFAAMIKKNEQAFLVAEEVLRKLGFQLIDWKQEYGWPFGSTIPLMADDLAIIDETTAGNVRVWPIKAEKLDLSRDNLLDQLDPEGMLDKQLFRDGKDLGTVKNAFEALMRLTDRFQEFYPPKIELVDNSATA